MQDEKAQASPSLHARTLEARTQQARSPHCYQVWKTLQEAATQKICTRASLCPSSWPHHQALGLVKSKAVWIQPHILHCLQTASEGAGGSKYHLF